MTVYLKPLLAQFSVNYRQTPASRYATPSIWVSIIFKTITFVPKRSLHGSLAKWCVSQGRKRWTFHYCILTNTPGPSPNMTYFLWTLKIHERKMKTTDLYKKQSKYVKSHMGSLLYSRFWRINSHGTKLLYKILYQIDAVLVTLKKKNQNRIPNLLSEIGCHQRCFWSFVIPNFENVMNKFRSWPCMLNYITCTYTICHVDSNYISHLSFNLYKNLFLRPVGISNHDKLSSPCVALSISLFTLYH